MLNFKWFVLKFGDLHQFSLILSIGDSVVSGCSDDVVIQPYFKICFYKFDDLCYI